MSIPWSSRPSNKVGNARACTALQAAHPVPFTAYKILSDPDTRCLYDRYGPELQPPFRESLLHLAPLLFSITSGVVGSTAYTFRYLTRFAPTLQTEILAVGLFGLVYWRQQRASRKRRGHSNSGMLSISDYVTITCCGLFIGNTTGWALSSCGWLFVGTGSSGV